MVFHVTEDGPKKCEAKQGKCPYLKTNPEHFETFQEASRKFEEMNETFKKVEKVGLPHVEIVSTLNGRKGGSYFGLSVSNEDVQPHLEAWRDYVGDYGFETMEQNKFDRDGEYAFHVTVLSPKDVRILRKSGIEIKNRDFKVELKGVGKVEDDSKEAWFILCESKEIDEYRESLGLGKHHLHITIGFMGGDIHNQTKDSSTLRIV